MRGRKPKPTAQKELENNPGKRPLNDREPEYPPAEDEVPPAELYGDTLANEEWARLFPLLKTARVMTEADRGTLLALCQQWSRYRRAMGEIDKSGMVVQAPSGYPIPNPYLGIANRALQHCMKLWAELGLTPSSRSRVTVAPGVNWSGNKQTAKPKSKLAELQEQAAALRRPLEVK